MTSRKAAEIPQQYSFEEAMQKLELIVSNLEDDKLPLDDMLARYEEGISLARICGEKLDAAEQKIRLISKHSTGSISLEPFDDSEQI